MAEIPPLNVRVNIDASSIPAGVAKATAGLEQINNRSKVMTSTMGNLKTTILGVFGGNLLTNAIYGIGRELNAMKQETIAIQAQTERLNTSLSNMGIVSKEAQQAVFESADAYYQLGFQGSEAISAMGTLVTATNDVTQAQKLMAMSADLARYKHIDMETAAKILARGTQGSAKAFKELGITLDTTIPKNEAISRAFDELNKKIGGQAQNYTKTFAGQMDILKERFDNVAQAIGAAVLPFLTKLVSSMAGMFQWINQNSAALKVFIGLAVTVTAALKGIAIMQAIIAGINPFTYVVLGAIAAAAAFVKLWNTFDWFRKGASTALAIVVKGIGYLIGGVSKLLGIMSKIPGLGFLKGVAEDASKAAESIGKFGDSVSKLGDKKIKAPKMPKITGAVKPGGKTGIIGQIPGGDSAVGDSGSGGGSQTIQYVTVYASNTNDIAKQLSKAAKNGVPVGMK